MDINQKKRENSYAYWDRYINLAKAILEKREFLDKEKIDEAGRYIGRMRYS